MRKNLLGALLLFAFGVGCSGDPPPPNVIPAAAKLALANSESVEVFSLEPFGHDGRNTGGFHTYQVLGNAAIDDREEREALVSAFRAGVPRFGESDVSCFWPRHGIRVLHQGKTYDFLICFECVRVDVYCDEAKIGSFCIEPAPQAAFDEFLKGKGIPLAKKSAE